MKKFLVAFLVGFFIGLFAYNATAAAFDEAWHVEKWCAEHGGQIEYRLEDRTRVDCLTDTHAVEFDWGIKWAESIGQALHYSYMTDKKAGVVLIVGDDEERFIKRLQRVANHNCITVWLMDNENKK